MLQIQKFLLTGSTVDLEAQHGVVARVHGHKASFNYDPLVAKDDDPIAIEARGLILGVQVQTFPVDKPIGTYVVARGFDRFFNLGQPCAAEIDWSTARYLEKVDGTLCLVYHDRGQWHVATRGVPEADLPVNTSEFTFRGLFERALGDMVGLSFEEWSGTYLNTLCTYLFELCTPVNQVVVPQRDFRLWLLGARVTATGREMDPSGFDVLIPAVPSHSLSGLETMLEFVGQRPGLAHEGLVVVDSCWRRVKAKNPEYVVLHRVVTNVVSSNRLLLELVLSEQCDDVFPSLPEYVQSRVLETRTSVQKWASEVDHWYARTLAHVSSAFAQEEHGSREHRKQFALFLQSEAREMLSVHEDLHRQV
jgi:hypothetical protein